MQAANAVTLICLSCWSLLFHKLLSSPKFYEMTRMLRTLHQRYSATCPYNRFFLDRNQVSYRQILQKPTAILLCASGDYFSHFLPPSLPSPLLHFEEARQGQGDPMGGWEEERNCFVGGDGQSSLLPLHSSDPSEAPASRGWGGVTVAVTVLRL